MNNKIWQRIDGKTLREPVSGCWLWEGCVTSAGYGCISIDHKCYPVHRLSYERYKGAISQGLEIDHLCRVHSCLNPDHLEAVTPSENVRRGLRPILNKLEAATRTHCRNGHPIVHARFETRRNGDVIRACAICASWSWRKARKEMV